jgi:hypothetical protein
MLGAMLAASLARGGDGPGVAEELLNQSTSIPVASGATVELLAVKGEASFLPSKDDKVLVEYAKAVPAEVKVVAVTTPAGITICTVYASSDPKKPTECLPGGKGRLSVGKEGDLSRVQFRVRVPAGVHVTATIDRGDLKTTGITGNLKVHSYRGDVLVWDAGGPGTIDASLGLLGNIDVVLSKDQKGPARRRVRLHAPGSGRVRVAMPTTVGASYSITTQTRATVDAAFEFEKVTPPIPRGHVGTADDHVFLDVDTGIAGQFMLVRAK